MLLILQESMLGRGCTAMESEVTLSIWDEGSKNVVAIELIRNHSLIIAANIYCLLPTKHIICIILLNSLCV